MTGKTDYRYFVGLPSPAGALTLAAMIFYAPAPVTDRRFAVIVMIVTIVTAFAMVSPIRYRSQKGLALQKERSLMYFVDPRADPRPGLPWPREFWFVGAIGYLVSGPLVKLWSIAFPSRPVVESPSLQEDRQPPPRRLATRDRRLRDTTRRHGAPQVPRRLSPRHRQSADAGRQRDQDHPPRARVPVREDRAARRDRRRGRRADRGRRRAGGRRAGRAGRARRSRPRLLLRSRGGEPASGSRGMRRTTSSPSISRSRRPPKTASSPSPA